MHVFKHIINFFYYTDVCRIWKKILLFLFIQSRRGSTNTPAISGLHFISPGADTLGAGSLGPCGDTDTPQTPVEGWLLWVCSPFHLLGTAQLGLLDVPSAPSEGFWCCLRAQSPSLGLTGEGLCFLSMSGDLQSKAGDVERNLCEAQPDTGTSAGRAGHSGP